MPTYHREYPMGIVILAIAENLNISHFKALKGKKVTQL